MDRSDEIIIVELLAGYRTEDFMLEVKSSSNPTGVGTTSLFREESGR